MSFGHRACYRVRNGVRERFCTGCARWLVHVHPTFYLHADKPYGLQSTCAACVLTASKAAQKRRNAYHTQQREYARAAFEGRL